MQTACDEPTYIRAQRQQGNADTTATPLKYRSCFPTIDGHNNA